MAKAPENPEFKKLDPYDCKAAVDAPDNLDLEPRLFAWIEGQGDPNGPDFALATGALYGLSYAVRMCYRSEPAPKGACAYTVGVLQGRWDLVAGAGMFDPKRKDQLAWAIMIRQPAFCGQALFERFRDEAKAKAAKKGEVDPSWFDRLRFGLRDGGRFAQIMHHGPYADESASFARLEAALASQGLKRKGKHHWELYHSDPRRTAPEKMRTILRVELA